MSKYLSPGVYRKVTNVSQITALATATTFALVTQATRGPLGPRYYGSSRALLNALGNPNQGRSVALWAALEITKRGGGVWVNNIAGAGATTAYSMLAIGGDSGNPMTATAGNAADPSATPWDTDDILRVDAIGPGSYYAGVGYAITAYEADTELFTLSVYHSSNPNAPVETHVFTLRDGLDAGGVQQFAEDVVNGNSLYIRVTVNPAVRAETTPVAPGGTDLTDLSALTYLTGGIDGADATAAEVIAGWDVFTNRKQYDFDVAVNGGDTRDGVRTKIDSVMANRGSGIALLDLVATAKTAQLAIADRETNLLLRSRFSALYGPRYMIYSPYEDRNVYVPASGGVAAAAVYSDSVKDVWWAFAGANRGVIPGAIGLEAEWEQADLDLMYPKSINAIINEPGVGIMLFGNRTLLQDNSALWSVNVQRLVSVVQDSCEAYLKTELFQQNDDVLGRAIETNIGAMLRQVQAGRGLYRWRVVSDATNNSPQDLDELTRNVDVYLQPTRSAEIIVLNTVVTRTGADFGVSSTTDNSVFG